MQLVILAGGFGTRLKSVLNGLPKPLADINGQPFLKLLFQNWVKNGFNDFVLCLHYEADKIVEFVNQEQDFGALKNCKIQFSIEPTPVENKASSKSKPVRSSFCVFVLNNFDILYLFNH